MNMKNIKINSQTRSNFLLSNAMFMPGFYDKLEEIGRNWINSFILSYDFYFYGLDKMNEIKNKSLHKKKTNNAPNKDLRLKQAINKCFDEFINVTIKHPLCVGCFIAGTQVLYQLVRMQYIIPYL